MNQQLIISRKAEELGSEVLYAVEHQRGLLGKSEVQVVIGNHDHLHACCQAGFHSVRRVLKNQTLQRETLFLSITTNS